MKKYKITTIDNNIFEIERSKTEFLDNYVAFYLQVEEREARIIIPWSQIKKIEEIIV